MKLFKYFFQEPFRADYLLCHKNSLLQTENIILRLLFYPQNPRIMTSVTQLRFSYNCHCPTLLGLADMLPQFHSAVKDTYFSFSQDKKKTLLILKLTQNHVAVSVGRPHSRIVIYGLQGTLCGTSLLIKKIIVTITLSAFFNSVVSTHTLSYFCNPIYCQLS